MPLGEIAGRDGRRFRLTRPDAVIADFARRGHPLPVEHAGASARQTGRAAPAAGWITELKVEDAMLWARIDRTERGRAMVAAREHRFLSPEFHCDPRTGEVLAPPSAGLVHHPNLRLAALNRQEPVAMTDAPDPDMPGGAAAPIPERLRTALGLAEGAGEADALAAVARLREEPDPARFVPVAAMRELMAERHAGAAARAEQDVGRKVEDALARGCISPAMVPRATALCRNDPANFDALGEGGGGTDRGAAPRRRSRARRASPGVARSPAGAPRHPRRRSRTPRLHGGPLQPHDVRADRRRRRGALRRAPPREERDPRPVRQEQPPRQVIAGPAGGPGQPPDLRPVAASQGSVGAVFQRSEHSDHAWADGVFRRRRRPRGHA